MNIYRIEVLENGVYKEIYTTLKGVRFIKHDQKPTFKQLLKRELIGSLRQKTYVKV